LMMVKVMAKLRKAPAGLRENISKREREFIQKAHEDQRYQTLLTKHMLEVERARDTSSKKGGDDDSHSDSGSTESDLTASSDEPKPTGSGGFDSKKLLGAWAGDCFRLCTEVWEIEKMEQESDRLRSQLSKLQEEKIDSHRSFMQEVQTLKYKIGKLERKLPMCEDVEVTNDDLCFYEPLRYIPDDLRSFVKDVIAHKVKTEVERYADSEGIRLPDREGELSEKIKKLEEEKQELEAKLGDVQFDALDMVEREVLKRMTQERDSLRAKRGGEGPEEAAEETETPPEVAKESRRRAALEAARREEKERTLQTDLSHNATSPRVCTPPLCSRCGGGLNSRPTSVASTSDSTGGSGGTEDDKASFRTSSADTTHASALAPSDPAYRARKAEATEIRAMLAEAKGEARELEARPEKTKSLRDQLQAAREKIRTLEAKLEGFKDVDFGPLMVTSGTCTEPMERPAQRPSPLTELPDGAPPSQPPSPSRSTQTDRLAMSTRQSQTAEAGSGGSAAGSRPGARVSGAAAGGGGEENSPASAAAAAVEETARAAKAATAASAEEKETAADAAEEKKAVAATAAAAKAKAKARVAAMTPTSAARETLRQASQENNVPLPATADDALRLSESCAARLRGDVASLKRLRFVEADEVDNVESLAENMDWAMDSLESSLSETRKLVESERQASEASAQQAERASEAAASAAGAAGAPGERTSAAEQKQHREQIQDMEQEMCGLKERNSQVEIAIQEMNDKLEEAKRQMGEAGVDADAIFEKVGLSSLMSKQAQRKICVFERLYLDALSRVKRRAEKRGGHLEALARAFKQVHNPTLPTQDASQAELPTQLSVVELEGFLGATGVGLPMCPKCGYCMRLADSYAGLTARSRGGHEPAAAQQAQVQVQQLQLQPPRSASGRRSPEKRGRKSSEFCLSASNLAAFNGPAKEFRRPLSMASSSCSLVRVEHRPEHLLIEDEVRSSEMGIRGVSVGASGSAASVTSPSVLSPISPPAPVQGRRSFDQESSRGQNLAHLQSLEASRVRNPMSIDYPQQGTTKMSISSFLGHELSAPSWHDSTQGSSSSKLVKRSLSSPILSAQATGGLPEPKFKGGFMEQVPILNSNQDRGPLPPVEVGSTPSQARLLSPTTTGPLRVASRGLLGAVAVDTMDQTQLPAVSRAFPSLGSHEVQRRQQRAMERLQASTAPGPKLLLKGKHCEQPLAGH